MASLGFVAAALSSLQLADELPSMGTTRGGLHDGILEDVAKDMRHATPMD